MGDAARVDLGQRVTHEHRRACAHDAGGDPRHIVTEERAKNREKSVADIRRISEQRHVGKPSVHRQIAHPSKCRNMPKRESRVAVGRAASPDRRLPHTPKLAERPDRPDTGSFS